MIRKTTAAVILLLIMCIQNTCIASASEIHEFIRFLDGNQAVRFEITAEYEKLPQFDEKRTEQLNRLVCHLSFHGLLDFPEANLTVSLDHRDLFSILHTETSEGTDRKILITDPEQIYILPEEKNAEQMSELSFLNVFSDISFQKELYGFLEPFSAIFEQLPDYFPEKSGSVQILEKYKDYGTAVKKIRIRIEAEEVLSYIRDYLNDFSDDHPLHKIRELVFSGKQDFELLVTDEGKVMKIRYGGIAGFSGEDLRTVRLEWKTVRNESVERDELSLRTPNKDASKRNNLLIDYLWRITEEGKETLSWKAETDSLENGNRIREIAQCSAEREDETLSGTFSQSTSEKKFTNGNEIHFSALLNQADQYSGTLEIISKKDKIEKGKMKLDFILSADMPVVVRTAADPVPVSEREYEEIRQKLFSKLLLELMKLPAEDLVFLTEGIPDEKINEIPVNREL